MGIAISQPKMGNQGAICQEFPNHMIHDSPKFKGYQFGFSGTF